MITPVPKVRWVFARYCERGSNGLRTSFDRAALPHFPGRNLRLAIPILSPFSLTGTLFPIRLFHSQLLLGTGIAVCNAA